MTGAILPGGQLTLGPLRSATTEDCRLDAMLDKLLEALCVRPSCRPSAAAAASCLPCSSCVASARCRSLSC